MKKIWISVAFLVVLVSFTLFVFFSQEEEKEGREEFINQSEIEVNETKNSVDKKESLENSETEDNEPKDELSFSDQVLHLCKTKNEEDLKKLILPLKQEKPVFGSLLETEDGEKYYALGKILKDFYKAKNVEVLCFLLENGASGFIESGEDPMVLSYLEYSIINNDVKTLEKLLKAGAKQNVYSSHTNITPDLSIAIKNKAYESMEFLLQNGADPNYTVKTVYVGEPGRETKSVLFDAVEDAKAMEILFEHGAKEGLIRTKNVVEEKNGERIEVKYQNILERKGEDFVVTEKVSVGE